VYTLTASSFRIWNSSADIFVQIFCVFLPSLQISSASVRSIPFMSFIVPIIMKCSLGISIFLKEISSLPHSIVFPIYLHCFLKKALKKKKHSLLFSETLDSVEYTFPFLLCLSCLFFSQLFVRRPQVITLPYGISFFLGVWFCSLSLILCYEFLFTVYQALCLSQDLIPWIYLSPPLYNDTGYDLGHTRMA